MEEGRWYLPGAPTGYRETLVTRPITAEPDHILLLPGPGWAHVIAAVATAGVFLALTVKTVWVAGAASLVALGAILVWLWQGPRPRSLPPVDIGGGYVLPVNPPAGSNLVWWAMGILLFVDGTILACLVFSYLFLWTVTPGDWPPAGIERLPDGLSALSAGLMLAAGALYRGTDGLLRRNRRVTLTLVWALATLLAVLGAALPFAGLGAAGLDPTSHGYAATAVMLLVWQALHAGLLVVMAGWLVAPLWARRLDAEQRSNWDHVGLMWGYTALQGPFILALLQLFPLVAGGRGGGAAGRGGAVTGRTADAEDRHAGFGPLVWPLVLWAAHFVAIYAANALACASGLHAAHPWLSPTLVFGLTGAVAVPLLWLARRWLRHGTFLARVGAGLALFALFAAVLKALPAAIIPACA